MGINYTKRPKVQAPAMEPAAPVGVQVDAQRVFDEIVAEYTQLANQLIVRAAALPPEDMVRVTIVANVQVETALVQATITRTNNLSPQEYAVQLDFIRTATSRLRALQ